MTEYFDYKNGPKILFYDIETTPIRAWVWRPGKQHVSPKQILTDEKGRPECTDIICITYCWNDGKPAKSLDWGYYEQWSAPMIEAFDRIIEQADITIGKNSQRFDEKHINMQRLIHGLPPMPDWIQYSDDLEKQMRRHFAFPSQGLDYISSLFGLGGKDSMCLQDWIDIVEQNNKDKFHKMIRYGKKDVEDTRTLWNKVAMHCKPRYNYNAGSEENVCARCGSPNIFKNGTRKSGQTLWQRYYCRDHGGPAGRATINKAGRVGKVS